MQTKTTRRVARFRAGAVDVKERTFEGLSAAYALDHGGDVIQPGAFMEDLLAWRSDPQRIIPLVDQHSYNSVRSVYGVMVDAHENDDGLWSRFKVVDSADGDEALARLQEGIINGLSIGFEVQDQEPGEMEGQKVRRLKTIALREVSLVIWGMNPRALVIPDSVKGGSDEAVSTYSPGWDRTYQERLPSADEIRAALPYIKDEKTLRAIASQIGTLLRPSSDGNGDGMMSARDTEALKEAMRQDLLAFQIKQTLAAGGQLSTYS